MKNKMKKQIFIIVIAFIFNSVFLHAGFFSKMWKTTAVVGTVGYIYYGYDALKTKKCKDEFEAYMESYDKHDPYAKRRLRILLEKCPKIFLEKKLKLEIPPSKTEVTTKPVILPKELGTPSNPITQTKKPKIPSKPGTPSKPVILPKEPETPSIPSIPPKAVTLPKEAGRTSKAPEIPPGKGLIVPCINYTVEIHSLSVWDTPGTKKRDPVTSSHFITYLHKDEHICVDKIKGEWVHYKKGWVNGSKNKISQ